MLTFGYISTAAKTKITDKLRLCVGVYEQVKGSTFFLRNSPGIDTRARPRLRPMGQSSSQVPDYLFKRKTRTLPKK